MERYAYAPVQTNTFIWDGWNTIAEILSNPATGNSTTNFYTSAQDLSGTLQGAGGVGGLLIVSINGTNCFPCFDGNGNVMGLVNTSNGSVVATYEYSPFGECIEADAAMVSANPWRFSTKCTDGESGLLYYGYRFYEPGTGRWLSRDPVGETGGKDLYGFVRNSPVSLVDTDGRGLFGAVFSGVGISSGGQNAPAIPLGGAFPGPVAPQQSTPLQSCGKADVTASVQQLLTKIGKDYDKWTYCQKVSHCMALRYPGTALNGWDIETLKDVGFGIWPFANNVPPGSAGTCANTVILGGKCYHGGAVNYVLWGKANALCHSTFPMSFDPTYSLASSRTTVFAWKTVYLWAQAGEAMSFTGYGYQGGNVPTCSLGHCDTSGAIPSQIGDYWWNQLF